MLRLMLEVMANLGSTSWSAFEIALSALSFFSVVAALWFFRKRAVESERGVAFNELRHRVEAFENLVREFHIIEKNERLRLAKSIDSLAQEAGVLTQIFRMDQKSQGDFGEFMLETVLSSAGLRKGEDFVVQESVQVGGDLLRPDVVVQLPEGRHLVIDSKVSMTAWDSFVRAGSDFERAEALDAHISSVRRHIRELSNRNYQSADSLNTPDFVFLFTPIEAAWIETVRFEPSLFDEAWSKRVVIVSPTTLYASLKTVASLWTRERQNQNARAIAKEAGSLQHQIGKFLSELDGIESDLRKSLVRVEGARQRSAQVVEHVEKLRELGVEAPVRSQPSV